MDISPTEGESLGYAGETAEVGNGFVGLRHLEDKERSLVAILCWTVGGSAVDNL